MTKDAKKMLYVLYKEYKNRRKNGVSISDSKDFVSAAFVHENFFPDMPLCDVEEIMRELGRNDYLNNMYASGTIYMCWLTDKSIETMENQKKEALLNVTDFISKFIP